MACTVPVARVTTPQVCTCPLERTSPSTSPLRRCRRVCMCKSAATRTASVASAVPTAACAHHLRAALRWTSPPFSSAPPSAAHCTSTLAKSHFLPRAYCVSSRERPALGGMFLVSSCPCGDHYRRCCSPLVSCGWFAFAACGVHVVGMGAWFCAYGFNPCRHTVVISGAARAPFFVLGEMTNADWQQQLTNPAPYEQGGVCLRGSHSVCWPLFRGATLHAHDTTCLLPFCPAAMPSL